MLDFFTKKASVSSDSHVQFYSNTINDRILRKKILAIDIIKGAGYNNLVTDEFKVPLPLAEGAGLFGHQRLKLTRGEDKKSWNIVKITRFDLGANDQTGLHDGETRETLGTARCLFDALHFCAAFEKQYASCREGRAGRDYEGMAHWRKAAAGAGQVVTIGGGIVPCADGEFLVKGDAYDKTQRKILALTRKADPKTEEPGFLSGLFSSSAPEKPAVSVKTPQISVPVYYEEKRPEVMRILEKARKEKEGRSITKKQIFGMMYAVAFMGVPVFILLSHLLTDLPHSQIQGMRRIGEDWLTFETENGIRKDITYKPKPLTSSEAHDFCSALSLTYGAGWHLPSVDEGAEIMRRIDYSNLN